MKKQLRGFTFVAGMVVTGGLLAQERSIDDATDTITVTIPAQSAYYVVTERVPEDAYPVAISDRGVYDASTGLIKWGPFRGEEAVELTYRLVGPPSRFTDIFGNLQFSLGGFPEQITGELRLGLNGDDYASWAMQVFGVVEAPQADPYWDADEDRMPNFAEWVLLRDPLQEEVRFLSYDLIPGASPQVRLSTRVASGQEGRVRIQRMGFSGSALEAQADLTIETQGSGDAVILEAVDALSSGGQFYRVLIEE